MKYALLCSLLFCFCFHPTKAQNLQEYYKAAQEAHKAGDNHKFYENITHAYQLHPYHQGILYQCGIAAAM
jgi:hypothetical protein